MILEKTNWNGIVSGSDNGDVVEAKLTEAFTNIDVAIEQIDSNTIETTANSQSISDIVAIDKNFNHSSVYGVSTNSSIYSSLNVLTVINAPVGVYQLTISTVFSYSSTSRSSFFRVIQNGGAQLEFRSEPKDNTDNKAKAYIHVVEHNGGDFTIEVDYRTESNSDVLAVAHHQITLEQKL